MPAFPPIEAWILGNNKVISVRARPLAELVGSDKLPPR